MRFLKWMGVLAAIVLIITCFMTWVVVHSRNIVVTGIDTTGTNFGKPAYFHFICIFIFLLFTFTGKLWSARANLIVGALNLAWAIRNFFIITMCRSGECPEKKIAIYLVVFTSVVIMVAALFPDIRLNSRDRNADVTVN